mgnify:CR=1 FL=1
MRRMSGSTILPGKNTRKNPGTSSKGKSKMQDESKKMTVLILRDEDKIAICKRPAKGLLAGLYELPNIEEHLNKKEITQYCKEIGLMPIHIKKLPAAKHIFSHIEWQMIGYDIRVDELEKTNNKKYLFIHSEEIQRSIPSRQRSKSI